MTLDDLRARFPHLGFALFAMDPADPVTLEAYGPGGETFQWRGASVADVLAKAFPAPVVSVNPAAAGSQPATPMLPPESAPVGTVASACKSAGFAETTGSVFD